MKLLNWNKGDMIYHILIEWCVILCALLICKLIPNPIIFFLATLIIGSRQHALGIIGHWAMHGVIPKWMMLITFLPVGIDKKVYGASHGLHHKYLGSDKDPEVHVVSKYKDRWSGPLRKSTILKDILWLHLDESIDILKLLVSVKSLIVYAVFVFLLFLIFGPVALIYPASINGLLLAHRYRARTEHDHLRLPGCTFQQTKPSLLQRMWYLPHYTWLHYEHHQDQTRKVW